MDIFLNKLALYLIEKFGKEIEEHCIVFPNRRAGLFFKKYYASKQDPGWMPEIVTIGDFMKRISGLEPADPLELSFEIYRIYRSLTDNPESYDEFYPWGEMMLSDFNDIDKYLVDAAQLFRNITDIKEIEQIFDYLDQEQKDLISRFWSNFDPEKMSGQKESFLFIWKLLLPVYENLYKNLMEKGLAYEGMIYRRVAEKLITESEFEWPWQNIHICGFNALSASEEKVFSSLQRAGKASFYWDYDDSFIRDKDHEAGRFLRKNIQRFPASTDFLKSEEKSSQKSVKVYSLPSDILQAKEVYNILGEIISEDSILGRTDDFNKTAVILGDESLLPPVLTSLPEEVERLNITMGFPVSLTPVYSFTEAVLKMQQNFNRRKQNPRFYFRDILTVLNHQYLKTFYQQKTEEFINYIHRENKIYISDKDFGDDSFFSLIFKRVESVNDFTSYLQDLFRFLLDTFPAEDSSFKLEKEYIFHIRTRLNKLQNLFEDQSIDLELESFIRLFRKVLSDFRIPFEGEPLQGIQFMGILESRLLNFENLIFMSMNEGVMPGKGSDFSYVPVNLRYAFGMPVREDKDAIYAYYFYRLLPSARNIYILYNSQTEGVQTGEPTRYIHQLKYLSKLKIQEYTRSFRVIDRERLRITVEKTDEIMEILNKYMDPEGRKYLSPSALTTYLDCSLRFYFSYVAGINEEDEASEEIDASGFGSLFHKCLELIYSETQGKMLRTEDIEKLMEAGNIKNHLDQAFREVFLRTDDRTASVKPEGRNIIIYEIIRKLIYRSLEIDKTVTPFKYILSEKHLDNHVLEIPEGRVHLGGLIDRIDNREGFLHVIDYKTGKVSPQFISIEGLFDRDSWKDNENLKGIFQTFLYSWLYSKEFPEEKYITPSIYQTRELFNRDFTPYLYDKSAKNTVRNFLDYSASFEYELKKLVSSLFDRDLDFTQTDDDKRCKVCPYKEICHRD